MKPIVDDIEIEDDDETFEARILASARNPQPVPEPPPPLMDPHTAHIYWCCVSVDEIVKRIDAMLAELGP